MITLVKKYSLSYRVFAAVMLVAILVTSGHYIVDCCQLSYDNIVNLPLNHKLPLFNEMVKSLCDRYPHIVQKIVRAVQQGIIPADDEDLLDGVLGLRVVATEKKIWETHGPIDSVFFGDESDDFWKHGNAGKFLEGSYTEQVEYQGTPYLFLRQLIKQLNLNVNDVVYDLGSGYGRVVLYTALASDVGIIKGVELLGERVESCESVQKKLNLSHVQFIAQNVRDIDFSDGTVFYLFNPFTTETLNNVIERLHALAQTRAKESRTIRIVSLGKCTESFDCQHKWLKRIGEIKCVPKLPPLVIYESILSPAEPDRKKDEQSIVTSEALPEAVSGLQHKKSIISNNQQSMLTSQRGGIDLTLEKQSTIGTLPFKKIALGEDMLSLGKQLKEEDRLFYGDELTYKIVCIGKIAFGSGIETNN